MILNVIETSFKVVMKVLELFSCRLGSLEDKNEQLQKNELHLLQVKLLDWFIKLVYQTCLSCDIAVLLAWEFH